MPIQPSNGAAADAGMRAANLAEWGAKGAINFERFRRFAQGNAALLKSASAHGKGLSRFTGPLGVVLEMGNTAWLASDPDKRKRAEEDFNTSAKKPAVERVVEGAVNASDTLYAMGKSAYDTGKTYESIERSQMDEVNNDLLRKIAKHEASMAEDRASQNRQAEIDELRKSLAPPADVLRSFRHQRQKLIR